MPDSQFVLIKTNLWSKQQDKTTAAQIDQQTTPGTMAAATTATATATATATTAVTATGKEGPMHEAIQTTKEDRDRSR